MHLFVEDLWKITFLLFSFSSFTIPDTFIFYKISTPFLGYLNSVPYAAHREAIRLIEVEAEYLSVVAVQVPAPCIGDIFLRRRPPVAEVAHPVEWPIRKAVAIRQGRKTAAVGCTGIWAAPVGSAGFFEVATCVGASPSGGVPVNTGGGFNFFFECHKLGIGGQMPSVGTNSLRTFGS